jgi:hypothetical protein
MTFTSLKCTPLRLSLHLDDLSMKILFHFELDLKVKPFQLVHHQWPSLLKYFLCFGCLGCIYLYYSLFGKGWQTICDKLLGRRNIIMCTQYLVHATLFLNNYVQNID